MCLYIVYISGHSVCTVRHPWSTSGTVWTSKKTQALRITTKEFLPKLTHGMSITCEG